MSGLTCPLCGSMCIDVYYSTEKKHARFSIACGVLPELSADDLAYIQCSKCVYSVNGETHDLLAERYIITQRSKNND